MERVSKQSCVASLLSSDSKHSNRSHFQRSICSRPIIGITLQGRRPNCSESGSPRPHSYDPATKTSPNNPNISPYPQLFISPCPTRNLRKTVRSSVKRQRAPCVMYRRSCYSHQCSIHCSGLMSRVGGQCIDICFRSSIARYCGKGWSWRHARPTLQC